MRGQTLQTSLQSQQQTSPHSEREVAAEADEAGEGEAEARQATQSLELMTRVGPLATMRQTTPQ